MAINNPQIEKIITDCKEIMSQYCAHPKRLFKMGDSNTNITDVFFFIGKDKFLGSNTPRGYSISTTLGQRNITILTFEKGLFSITTDDPENYDYITNTYSTQEQIDRPLMIAIRLEDIYYFVGLAILGSKNKIGVFSVVTDLPNAVLRQQLIFATENKDYLACFNHKDKFFNEDEFKLGISTNVREHAAAEMRQLQALTGKKQIKAKKNIAAIQSALENNNPEALQTALEKKCNPISHFFGGSKPQITQPNLLYRNLSKPSNHLHNP